MSILLLILLLLFGFASPGGIVADPAVETPVIVAEPPPLPPDVVNVDDGTPEADPTGASPAIPEPPAEDPEAVDVAAAWADPNVFVDARTVHALSEREDVAIVALTPQKDYVAGHVPGSAFVDWPDLTITETGDQQVATWRADVEATLTRLGIAPTDTVVIYDGGTLYASRLWWVLDQLGHRNKLILDGGLPAWEAAGFSVDTGADIPVPDEEPYVGTPNEAAIATIDEVEAALNDPNVAFVDARTPEEFAKGHLPGAVNIPFTDNAVPDSGGRWKSPDELRAMYAAAGVTPDKRVIPYCQTGVRSAATYVTLTALGYPDVSLFTGSWAEWSADPARPVEV